MPALAFQNVVGESEALRQAITHGCRVAAHGPPTVLLVGETGTGKELFARGLHYSSRHPGEPFVAINCAAIPESLLESELFGHERGAFSGAGEQKRGLLEIAARGTVFLDEVGELPPALQPKLLRVLEERSVRRVGGLREQPIHCRIIAATNRDLTTAVSEATFRSDLFFRLSAVTLELPPLRDRMGDVELLARHFLDLLARERGVRPKRLHPDTLMALRAYHWPGNVRELRNAMEGALIVAEGDVVRPEHVSVRRRSTVSAPIAVNGRPAVAAIAIPEGGLTLAETERRLIELTMQLAKQNQSEAARMLRISRPTLARKLKKYGLSPKTPA